MHPNTVAEWIKAGLPVIDKRRPKLILGRDLNAFLEGRSRNRKRPCRPGEIFCVRCRAAKFPAGAMVDYEPQTAQFVRLVGLCPDCESLMYQQCSNAKLIKIRDLLDITTTMASGHVADSNESVVNSGLK